MLGKLIKHDLNYSKKSFFSIAGLMIVLSIILALSISFNAQGIAAISIFLLIIAMTASNIITVVLIFNGYRKSLFGQNGYLFLTLPVLKKQLLLSKILSALIWFNFMIVVFIIMGISIVFITSSFFSNLSWLVLDPNIQWLKVIGNALYGLFFINISAFVITSILFMTITFANVSFRNKRVHWIVAGALGLTYWSIYSIGAGRISNSFLNMTTFSIRRFDVTISMLYSFVVGVISYFITLYLLKKRIELD